MSTGKKNKKGVMAKYSDDKIQNIKVFYKKVS